MVHCGRIKYVINPLRAFTGSQSFTLIPEEPQSLLRPRDFWAGCPPGTGCPVGTGCPAGIGGVLLGTGVSCWYWGWLAGDGGVLLV